MAGGNAWREGIFKLVKNGIGTGTEYVTRTGVAMTFPVIVSRWRICSEWVVKMLLPSGWKARLSTDSVGSGVFCQRGFPDLTSTTPIASAILADVHAL